LLLNGCEKKDDNNIIRFGTSADYPPFEYYENGKMTGFEVELAQMIAAELGKEAKIEDMPFDSILISLNNDTIDAGIACFVTTEDRKQNYDFSDCYHHDVLAIVYKKGDSEFDKSDFRRMKTKLENAKIGCQLGTTMEVWLKKNVPNSEIISMDVNNKIIEALKAGHIEYVLIDYTQAVAFCEKNHDLNYHVIEEEGKQEGNGIAFKKGSSLREKINVALKSLESSGKIQKLKEKWLKWKK
jgi:polar amino acid transport system substrate-binding protein